VAGPQYRVPSPWVALVGGVLLLFQIVAQPFANAAPPGDSANERSQTLASILASWKARQERVNCFHFSWDSRVVLPKGYLYGNGLVGGLRADGMEVDDAPEFSILDSSFWVEGQERIRDDFPELRYLAPKDRRQTARIRKIVDGKTVSRLATPLEPGRSPQLAIWGQASASNPSPFAYYESYAWRDPRTLDWGPICLTFRSLNPILGWAATDRCRIVGEEVLDKVRCIKVQMDELDRSEMCWVDPTRDNIVVRWEKRQGFFSPTSIAIDYRQDKQHGWVPVHWKRDLPAFNSPLRGKIESTVTRYTINEKLPADTFACSSPPGTMVCNVAMSGSPLAPPESAEPRATASKANGVQVLPAADTKPVAPPSMEAIAAIWTKRQSSTKSFKFSWKGEQIRARSHTIEPVHSVLVDGNKFAYVEDNDPYRPDVAQYIIDREGGATARRRVESSQPRGSVAIGPPARVAFDGTSTRTYRALNDPLITGVGYLRPGFHVSQIQRPGPECMLLTFRPLDPFLGSIDTAGFRVLPERGKLGDVSCVIIESIEDGRAATRTSYWLDPARDYIVLCKHQTNRGRDTQRMDITYRRDPVAGWVPTGCKVATVSAVGMSCTVNSCTISDVSINQPVAPQEFLVDFPKGTTVHEQPRGNTAQDTGVIPIHLHLGGVRRDNRRRRTPDAHAKPVFNPFADAMADVDAAIKLVDATHKKVLVLVGDNGQPEALQVYTILTEDPDVAPFVSKAFVLVLVDLCSDSGGTVQDKYFQAPQRQGFPHIGLLDNNAEILQYQPLSWFRGDDDFDPHRIKKLLSYFVTSE
jgi:hypothetical protein